MSRYAIGDIHGGAKTFRALLERLDMKRDDRIYLLGDYVDRGPNSKGVLDIILKLIDVGFDIRPLRGNHEDMLISHFDIREKPFPGYVKDYGAVTLRSFGIETPAELPDRYKEFLIGLPYILEDGRFIFVHAGLDMNKDNPVTETTPETMLWGDGGFISNNEIPGRIIVSGHRIKNAGYIKESLDQPHIQIDNGAFINQPPDFGYLVALNLDAMELIFQKWIDEEAVLSVCKNNVSFALAPETVPTIKEDMIMNLITDESKASRLARVMMDDIGQYFPELVDQGINEDNIFDLLHDKIEEAQLEFDKMVSPDLDRKKIFNSALVNVLIKRAYKFKHKQ
jgi:serine/threonine protein phosphatase 1